MLYTTHLDQVILLSTIPSNLAFDAPVNEETKKVNLFETEKNNHTPRPGHTALNHTIKPCIGCSSE